jgi:hypothetical protein
VVRPSPGQLRRAGAWQRLQSWWGRGWLAGHGHVVQQGHAGRPDLADAGLAGCRQAGRQAGGCSRRLPGGVPGATCAPAAPALLHRPPAPHQRSPLLPRPHPTPFHPTRARRWWPPAGQASLQSATWTCTSRTMRLGSPVTIACLGVASGRAAGRPGGCRGLPVCARYVRAGQGWAGRFHFGGPLAWACLPGAREATGMRGALAAGLLGLAQSCTAPDLHASSEWGGAPKKRWGCGAGPARRCTYLQWLLRGVGCAASFAGRSRWQCRRVPGSPAASRGHWLSCVRPGGPGCCRWGPVAVHGMLAALAALHRRRSAGRAVRQPAAALLTGGRCVGVWRCWLQATMETMMSCVASGCAGLAGRHAFLQCLPRPLCGAPGAGALPWRHAPGPAERERACLVCATAWQRGDYWVRLSCGTNVWCLWPAVVLFKRVCVMATCQLVSAAVLFTLRAAEAPMLGGWGCRQNACWSFDVLLLRVLVL